MFNLFKTNSVNYENITAEQLSELKDQADHVVLDVRSPAELAEGSIPGHTMINFFDPSFRTEVEKLDKSKAYLIYCRSGNRSVNACHMMGEMGFTRLYNLVGGIGAWNRAMAVSG